jgi:DNA (cytosine-5)-methyltransferase 1
MELGLERAGFETRWQVENDGFASAVLRRHWPDVPNFGDITKIDWQWVPRVGLLCGGFPCQNTSSVSVQRAGLQGEHSGLWTYFAQAIGEIRPRYVLVENSCSLTVRGLNTVLGDLANFGYDAEWDCIPAAAVGANHLRARIWILAYPAGERDGVSENSLCAGGCGPIHSDWWSREPDVRRVDDGIPDRVDRLTALGNAVVPQITEHIGNLIMNWLSENHAITTGDE